MVNSTSLEVRAGYFALCVKYADGIWDCNSDVATLAARLEPADDPLNLIWQSAKFRDSIVFYGLM